jgi:mono/diheme cytochrome c family protein
MRDLALIFIAIFSMATSSVSGQTLLGDAVQGHAFARKVCAECHNVEKGEAASKLSRAPSFQAITNDPSATGISLRVFLRTSHKIMPNLVLTETEADNVIAYVLSLR